MLDIGMMHRRNLLSSLTMNGVDSNLFPTAEIKCRSIDVMFFFCLPMELSVCMLILMFTQTEVLKISSQRNQRIDVKELP